MERIDNRLTPSKIERLMELAEAATPREAPALGRTRRRVLAEKNIIESNNDQESVYGGSVDSRYNTRCDSSGLLDLDQCEVGEFCTGDMDKLSIGLSYSPSKSFYPSEITGRSTGTTEYEVADARSRDTNSIEALSKRLQQQSCDVADIVRNSISDYSFKPSQRDLSQDEMSFIQERGDLPVPPSQLDMNLTRAMTEQSLIVDRTPDISVSSYFMKGSANLSKMIARGSTLNEISMGPSLIEGDSRTYGVQPGFTTINDSDCIILDTSLDRIPTRQPRTFPAGPSGTSGPAGSSRPAGTSGLAAAATALCAPQLQHLTQPNSARSNEDSTLGTDTSLSISLISKCLGKCESEVTPSLLLEEVKLKKNSQQRAKPALPTREPNSKRDTFTVPNANKSRLTPLESDNPYFVCTLKQAGKSDTASSSSSVNTVIQAPIKTRVPSPFNQNKENIRKLSPSRNKESLPKKTPVDLKVKDSSNGRESRGHSPNKASRTPVTVQENRISTSDVTEDSPLQTSKGELLWCGFSPSYEYRELEQSVNWQELLRQQSFKGSSHWVEVEAEPVDGYVGVRTTATVKLTSVTDAFLTARLCLDESSPDNGSVAVDIPRLPVLLSPGVPEIFSITVTAYKPVNETITMAVMLQDTCEDTEAIQRAQLCVNFTVPNIKIVTVDNKGVVFPPMQFESETVKSFVMVSDCNKPLQIALSVSDKVPGVFTIGSVEEIRRDEIEKRLSNDHRLVNEDGLVAGSKYRVMKQTTKQVCVLMNQKALRVMMICKSPPPANSSKVTLNGSVSVHLVGTHTLLQTVALTAVAGTIKLLFQMAEDKLYLTTDPQTLDVKNAGTIRGAWRVIVRGKHSQHFNVTPTQLELGAGEVSALHISHAKQNHVLEGLLVLESVHEGKEVVVEVVAGQEKFTTFPIKTTHSELAWVREGRKDISLKNSSDRRVTVKCKIHGEGYFMEHPRDSGTETVLTFRPNECISLSIIYSPREKGCHKSRLILCLEQDSTCVKSVRLHGWCGNGGGHVRWASGVLTCGEMGIAFARRRSPVTLTLENRSRDPSFFSARLLFNMQYHSLTACSRVSPSNGVLAPHGSALLSIELDWARLERIKDAATTLASLFVLVGPEMSRRRILRILKNGQNEPASPAERLNRLKGQFPGEDSRHDQLIKDFDETMKSLPSITESVQELTAQIELNRDSPGESSIFIADETTAEHHTMLE